MTRPSNSIATIKHDLHKAEKALAEIEAEALALRLEAEKQRVVFNKHWRRVPIVVTDAKGNNAYPSNAGTFDSWDLRHVIDGKDRAQTKATIAAWREGTMKVSVGPIGNGTLPRNLARRVFTPTEADARRLARLDGVIDRARTERAQLIHEMPGRGTVWTAEQIIETTLTLITDKAKMAKPADEAHRIEWGDYSDREHYPGVDGYRRLVRQLTSHLSWLEASPTSEPCKCSACEGERNRLAWEAQRKEREAKYKADVAARERHAKHAGFHAGCSRCEDVAHAGDSPSHHKRPSLKCSRCAAEQVA